MPEIILLNVRWYCRYPLSYRDLEEMMLERGLSVDHSTVHRWVLKYAPELVLSQLIGDRLLEYNLGEIVRPESRIRE